MGIALPLLASHDATGAPPLGAARPRDLCTDCGISRSSDPSRCGRACQFIHPRYDELERQVHGRARDAGRPDELHFGHFTAMHRARMRKPRAGAQWTGITTRIAERLLETGMVDAVIATASAADDRWRPEPILATEPHELARCRGMKMGYSPVLALLDEARARGYTRLAVVGVACQVHALRALERELGLERLYVLGTPCSDNTTTERFHEFLALLTDRPAEVTYLEFLSDFRVELRFADGSHRFIPFVKLPISQLPPDFFPTTCRACFDYVNALSDLTVGYMAGEGDQWLIVRNARGRELLALVEPELELTAVRSSGNRRRAVLAFVEMTRRAAGGLPIRRAPSWARPLIHFMMRRFGPKGLEFARTRVEMKATEGILTLRREKPRRMRRMIPDAAWALAEPYHITPLPHERAAVEGGR